MFVYYEGRVMVYQEFMYGISLVEEVVFEVDVDEVV